MALCYQNAAIEVLGFERAIGNTARDSDITVRLGGHITHLEVEAHHRADFGKSTDDGLKVELERRAEAKADQKFGALPQGERGVVAVVCVLQNQDVHRAFEPRHIFRLRRAGDSLGWMPLRLVGVVHPDGLRFAILPL